MGSRSKRDAGVTLGIGKYIIPIPEGNQSRNSRQRAMPSQRCTKMSARLSIRYPLPADATGVPVRDGTEEILNSLSGTSQPFEFLLFLAGQSHPMTKVTLNRQPGQASHLGEVPHLVGPQRPADRQRAVMVKDGM